MTIDVAKIRGKLRFDQLFNYKSLATLRFEMGQQSDSTQIMHPFVFVIKWNSEACFSYCLLSQ